MGKKKKKRKVKKEVKKQMGKQKDKKKEVKKDVKKELEKVMRPYQQGFSGGKGRPPIQTRPAKIPDSWKRPLFRPPIIECPTEPYDMGGCVFPIEELHKPEAIECGEELVVCEHPGEKDITEIMGGSPDKMGGPEKMPRLVSTSSSNKDSEDMNEEE